MVAIALFVTGMWGLAVWAHLRLILRRKRERSVFNARVLEREYRRALSAYMKTR